MSYIYILHFDEPLHHARHYTGCTADLHARLIRHAQGAGARLTEVLAERAIEWRLGGLMMTSHANMRRQERALKDIANAARYCELCTAQPTRLKGCTPYSIDAVPFAADSITLRKECITPCHATIRVSDDHTTPETIDQIKWLMRADKDALGFIPAGGTQGLQYLVPNGGLQIAELNNEVVGYIAFTLNPRRDLMTIHQACVADGQRLGGIGRRLIQQARRKWPEAEVLAKVRNDLAANHFWRAIGFVQVHQAAHATSGRLINHYRINSPKD